MALCLHKYSIVLVARWEASSIVEWLIYHRSIGFDHVYLYCNDDDPRGLYEVVMPFLCEPKPYVTFIYFGLVGQQRQMYLHFLQKFRRETEWVAFFDADEFLRLSKTRTIEEFMASMPDDADCIYFNWIFFGTSGFKTRPEGGVLSQYTRRQRILHPFTKVMIRSEHFKTQWLRNNPSFLIWHDIGDVLGPINIYNAIGEPCVNYYHGFPAAAEQSLRGKRSESILQSAVLHHYTLKSEADFQRRFDRGTKGDFFAQTTWKDISDRGDAQEIIDATNEIEDRTLAEYWSKLLESAYARSVARYPEGKNIALGKLADQSSISSWSIGSDTKLDAMNAINGKITSRFQQHTEMNDPSWWSVDLLAKHYIREIRIFNRLDMGKERLSRLEISASDNGRDWTVIFRKDDDVVIGGADGHPLIWQASSSIVARHIRITLLSPNFLCLDQVEIYGDELHDE